MDIAMLPACEIRDLHSDAAAAINLAVVGETRDGARVLWLGLRRAEDLRGREQWAEELVDCYRKALDGYCRKYGVSPDLLSAEALVDGAANYAPALSLVE
ncbi:MAG TPA: hypothetical protein VFU47_08495 [Armatimonadota bacterium]|nr:hypothetical protein [Armatimonadota bacterium]